MCFFFWLFFFLNRARGKLGCPGARGRPPPPSELGPRLRAATCARKAAGSRRRPHFVGRGAGRSPARNGGWLRPRPPGPAHGMAAARLPRLRRRRREGEREYGSFPLCARACMCVSVCVRECVSVRRLRRAAGGALAHSPWRRGRGGGARLPSPPRPPRRLPPRAPPPPHGERGAVRSERERGERASERRGGRKKKVASELLRPASPARTPALFSLQPAALGRVSHVPASAAAPLPPLPPARPPPRPARAAPHGRPRPTRAALARSGAPPAAPRSPPRPPMQPGSAAAARSAHAARPPARLPGTLGPGGREHVF